MLANCEKPCLTSPRGNISPSIESGTPNHQAYVDLLKASYILYDIVLAEDVPQAILSDEHRKLISDLSEVSPKCECNSHNHTNRPTGHQR